MIITRETIKKKLVDWQENRLTNKQIKEWAEEVYDNKGTLYADDEWEEGDKVSVTREILESLTSLDMNLGLVEDVPIYIEFLKTDPGDYAFGFHKWNTALNSINYQERKAKFKGIDFYSKFCI